ncbi:MAG: ABC transporter ATP-binding protein [Alistipes sp.]|nr:ABC transporter ATP-binding protein [Alistipes sp.]
MIELKDITLAFGSRVLMRDASVRFEAGNMIALLGRNGTGKSTLLRAMAALGTAQGGEIRIDGKRLEDITPRDLARKVAFVNTERISVEALNVHDLVAIGRSPYTNWMGRLTEGDEEIVERSIATAGIEHLKHRNVETLSDGEAQRVMIARALAQQTDVILLDEPTSFLDLPNRYELCLLLQRLAHDESKCVIFSTHELDIALSLADSIALVDTPHLVHRTTQEMISSGDIERLFDSEHISFDAATHSIRLHK